MNLNILNTIICCLLLVGIGSSVFAQTTAEHVSDNGDVLNDEIIANSTHNADIEKAETDSAQTSLQPFYAQFDVSLNNKYIGEAEMELEQTDTDSFEVRLRSKATKGAAGFARARSRELARFSIENGQTRSLHYEKEEKLLFKKDNWEVDFDWQKDTLYVDEEGDKWSKTLEGDELDSLSIYLVLAKSAANQRPWLVANVVDNDSIDTYSYQILDNEQLDTSCGSLDTRVYQGILPDTYKKVWTWHAEKIDWLPIRVRKTRKSGDILQLDLRAIESIQSPSMNCGVIERS